MAQDVIVATFANRNQAYEAARDIDKPMTDLTI